MLGNKVEILHIIDSWGRWPHRNWIEFLSKDSSNGFLFLEDGPESLETPNIKILHSNIRSLGLSLRTGYKEISKSIQEFNPNEIICYGKWSQLAALPASFYGGVSKRWYLDIEMTDLTATQKAALKLVRKNFANNEITTRPWVKDEQGLVFHSHDPMAEDIEEGTKRQSDFLDIVVSNDFLKLSKEPVGQLIEDLSDLTKLRLLIENDSAGEGVRDALIENVSALVSSNDRELSGVVLVLDAARLTPNFVVQAFLSQSVLILPDVPMSRHFITPGENGLVYSPGDYSSVGEICRNLCADSALKTGLSKAGWQDALNRWSFEAQWRKLKEIL